MKCPKCNQEKTVKNGFVIGNQRYKCKECQYNFILTDRRSQSIEKKKLAIHMYLEGLGFRSKQCFSFKLDKKYF